jgi:hypothetical protein
MTINRRRAPSSKISSEKKKDGHKNEAIFASLIKGEVIKGTQKGDVKDSFNNSYSVKGGKKWQIFLYTRKRIEDSIYLNILKPCIDSFPNDYEKYLKDRITCISLKEKYIKLNGREAGKLLSNEEVIKELGENVYFSSKNLLNKNNNIISRKLLDKEVLKNFYNEALFNNDEVKFLTIKDNRIKDRNVFKIFTRDDVLNILTEKTFPQLSKAGRVPEDLNIEGQKILLCYKKDNGIFKIIVEIEVRNESDDKYRLLKFNMYSKDALDLFEKLPKKTINNSIITYGEANDKFSL